MTPDNQQADKLDAAIARVMKQDAADEAAASRVLARLAARPLPPQRRGFLPTWWPAALTDWNFAPAWPRMAALAAGLVLGVAVGASSFGTRIATNLDLVTVASADADSGAGLFDLDPELRP
jgi:hypothetical protein